MKTCNAFDSLDTEIDYRIGKLAVSRKDIDAPISESDKEIEGLQTEVSISVDIKSVENVLQVMTELSLDNYLYSAVVNAIANWTFAPSEAERLSDQDKDSICKEIIYPRLLAALQATLIFQVRAFGLPTPTFSHHMDYEIWSRNEAD